MYSHTLLGTGGLGLGIVAPCSHAQAAPTRLCVHRRPCKTLGSHRKPLRFCLRYPQKAIKETASTNGTTDSNIPRAASVFRNLFDSSTKDSPTSPARPLTTSIAAATALNASTYASPTLAAETATSSLVPPGPFATPSLLADGPQPLASLAKQVLTGQGAVQEDPVAAARQLQAFLEQYREKYGPETDARISAAVSKLQQYIDSYSGGGGVSGGGLSGSAAQAAAAAGQADGSGVGAAMFGDGEVVYHNYILEQLTGVLDWVNNLLLSSNPRPFVFDAYGRVVTDSAAAASVEQQREQLRAASSSLRLLIQQLQQVNRQYASVADPDESAALGQVLSQLTTMADRLAVAATRRPIPQPSAAAAADAAADAAAAAAAAGQDLVTSPYLRPEQVYGVDKYRDPLLRVLDGIYSAVVVDSGLREFLSGVKQLGDSLVASMSEAWSAAPPLGRLIAYIAAVAGVLFVMRTRLPPALLAPTDKFLGSGGSSGPDPYTHTDDDTGPPTTDYDGNATTTAAATNPTAAAAFAAIAANRVSSGSDGAGAAAAAASALEAIAAAGDGGNSNRFAGGGSVGSAVEGVDGGGQMSYGLSDSASPAYGGSPASSVPGGGSGAQGAGLSGSGMGNGWALLTRGGKQGGGSGVLSGGAGLFTSPTFPGSQTTAKSTPGDPHGNLRDWWGGPFGGQQQPSSPTTSPPQTRQQGEATQHPPPPLTSAHEQGFETSHPATPPSPPPPPPSTPSRRSRTVAESWEAFRRLNDTPLPAPSSPSPTFPSAFTTSTGGVLNTTAALAAAAVAAAVDPVALSPTSPSSFPPYPSSNPNPSSPPPPSDPKLAQFAAAAGVRMAALQSAPVRAALKERLRGVCLALGPVSSVVPGGEPLREEVDALLRQLEAMSPTDKPLNTVVDVGRRPTLPPLRPRVDPLLLGEWRLVYASNASGGAGGPSAAAAQAAGGGPNLLAQLLQLADSLPGFGMTHVVQRLSLQDPTSSTSFETSIHNQQQEPPQPHTTNGSFTSPPTPSSFPSFPSPASSSPSSPVVIVTKNSAVFRFGPLGSWRVSVRGRWLDDGGGMCASAEFESFAVAPVELWGLPLEQLLPEVVVPVPEALRSRSEWCTTYLDEDMRVGRGSGGALFLFRRGASEAEEVAAVAAMTGGSGSGRVGAGQAVGGKVGSGGVGPPAGTGAGAGGLRDPVMRPL